MGTYSLDGLPADLLSNNKIDERRLKVEATLNQSEVAQDALVTKTFTYDVDGNVLTRTTTNKTTNKALVETFTWVNNQLTTIDETII